MMTICGIQVGYAPPTIDIRRDVAADGSIFNNIVNPRFGGGGGDVIFFD